MTQLDPTDNALLVDLAEHELPRNETQVVRLGSSKGNWFRQVGWRHLVGIAALVFAIFPILFLVSAAFNPLGTLSSSKLIPTGAGVDNFTKLFKTTDFWIWLWNSIVISSLSSFLSIFIAAAAAFAFSRYRFKGRRGGLLGILLIQMFPQFLAVVAIYLMFASVSKLYPAIGFNTSWALILLYLGGALGGSVWLIKGFFDTVPKDLDESAKVDGATHPQIYFGIILPLVTPILAVTGLLAFISAMNEIIFTSVFLTESARRPPPSACTAWCPANATPTSAPSRRAR